MTDDELIVTMIVVATLCAIAAYAAYCVLAAKHQTPPTNCTRLDSRSNGQTRKENLHEGRNQNRHPDAG